METSTFTTIDPAQRDGLLLTGAEKAKPLKHNRHASVRVRNRITVTTYKTERFDTLSDYNTTPNPPGADELVMGT